MIEFIRKNEKTLKKIFYILWWIFYLNIGRVLLEGKGWGKDGESAIRGVFLVLYPLGLCHLYSLTKTDHILEFSKEQTDQFTPTQLIFAGLSVYGSCLAFIFLNLTHLIIYSIDIVWFLKR